MELALEGERLCQSGDLKNGVKFFEEAVRVGTTDDRTLSAIYSQLGNAYFYLEEYEKALDYHKQDVTLVNSIGDEAAEAKACGNLGNTYKMLGKFNEAAEYCERYLKISEKLNDEIGQARALYNLGNVYHVQGKRMIGTSEQESGELPNDIKASLQKAIEYYEMNLKVVTKLNDHVAMGRAFGNLGNTHYLLGNFEASVESHKRRLELAKQTNDKWAERRAHLNLGNANVFLGNFPQAIENYSATLELAKSLNDRHTEAHSCYSLANTYTFLRDYQSAISYHLKYLDLIKELDDKLGEGRACWSLVNIYQMVNDHESALVYAKKHYEIAEILGDETGLSSAKANIEELEETILQKKSIQLCQQQQQQQQDHSVCPSITAATTTTTGTTTSTTTVGATTISINAPNKKHGSDVNVRLSPDKRQEQEQRRFKRQLNSNLAADIDGLGARRRGRGDRPVRSSSNERLFDMIAHFQSGRIDDQRCEILIKRSMERNDNNSKSEQTPMKSTASSSSTSKGVADDKENFSSSATSSSQSFVRPKNVVSSAKSALKATYRKASLVAYPTSSLETTAISIQAQRRPTVSAEHRDQLFDLIAGAQGQRMDEQRASLPAFALPNGVLKNPKSANLLTRGSTIDQPSSTAKLRYQATTETIEESVPAKGRKERSSSITQAPILASATPLTTSNNSSVTKPKLNKLSRHYQTVDSDAQVHDEKFLDSLMKYQSTRFNDQRSEFPNKTRDLSTNQKDNKGQTNDFFNLIVKFQSDRIDDQRSAPPASTPASKTKNL